MGQKDIDIKARLRAEAAEEAWQADEQEARIGLRLRKWKLGTAWVGIALAASIISVVPFSKGYPLHEHAESVGKFLVYLSMILLTAFVWAGATTYNFWRYLRDTKETHRKFAPPGSKYRAGKSGTHHSA
jgi:hypothetical protein